ncbi:hypothetical protein FQU76_00625 [Streptomyces qinzhouensis]|uniref:Uncharacterized protein n=1 Tax=Streptomyces qinzhouensis TaxID=2599401 RepID=A0A5B8IBY7_9ACTN|nr:hypothetical protein FQU76_00625 [Streptomyces qinzhouensis]
MPPRSRWRLWTSPSRRHSRRFATTPCCSRYRPAAGSRTSRLPAPPSPTPSPTRTPTPTVTPTVRLMTVASTSTRSTPVSNCPCPT